MSTVLSSKSIRAIEKGILAGKCLSVFPDSRGSAVVVENEAFLSPEESESLLKGLVQPTPGTYLDMFIWEYEDGSVKIFAAKVGYHPNRISALKTSPQGISARLFRRMSEEYQLGKRESELWGKRLLGI
jgi:hypothetical protein